MKNNNYISNFIESTLQKGMICILLVCTFHSELFPDVMTYNIQKQGSEVIHTDISMTSLTDLFVFDALIGFSEERYDGGNSQPTESFFSVLNPRLYQINEFLEPNYRSFFIDN